MIKTNSSTTVEILGEEYRIEGEEKDYLRKIADSVDKELRQLQEETSLPSSGRLGILACLNMADQLQKFKNEHSTLTNELLNTVNKLISQIDNIIGT